MLSIGAVERDTGIGRDTLRIWERRYGFPLPVRNAKGERVYDEQQVRSLQIIKGLLDKGMRPGKVVGLTDTELNDMAQELEPNTADDPIHLSELKEFIDCVVHHDANKLNILFERTLIQQGLNSFILTICAPLLSIIGSMWARGELKIFEEHFVTRQLTQFLDAAMSKIPVTENSPPILLATFPNEPHGLILLMIESLLRNQRYSTVNLGSEVPIEQLAFACNRYQPQAIFLSFSGSYGSSALRNDLLDLAERLPVEIPVWVGGSGVKKMRKLPKQIVIKCNLNEVLDYKSTTYS